MKTQFNSRETTRHPTSTIDRELHDAGDNPDSPTRVESDPDNRQHSFHNNTR